MRSHPFISDLAPLSRCVVGDILGPRKALPSEPALSSLPDWFHIRISAPIDTHDPGFALTGREQI